MRFLKAGVTRALAIGEFLTAVGTVLVFQPTDAAGQSCLPPPAGLVSWWRGEGNASDWTGAHNGVLTNGVSFTNGVVGQAFALDGASGAIDVGPWFNLQVFSIALWVRASGSQQAYADMIDNNHDSFRSWVVQYRNTGLQFEFIRPTNGTGPSVAFDLIPDTWQFLVITLDSSFVGRVYLDGQLQGSAAGSGPISYDGTEFLRLGRHATGIRYFNGAIDEIDVYNRVLSDSEILALYGAGSAGKCLVPIPPSISTQPSDQTAFVGDHVAFSVGAYGTVPLSYRWRFNGTDINGATASSLVFTNVQFTNAGTYSVNVSNAAGTVTSANAALTVNPVPPCVPPSSGLVSWWRGEGNFLDQVGTNPGALVGNTTFGVGRVGQGFVMDGNGDAVSVGNPTNLRLQDFTIETWIQRASASVVSTTPGSDGFVFAYGTSGYSFGLDSSGHLFVGKIGADKPVSTAAVTDTNLHHVAVTKSGTNLVFYRDGVAYPAGPYVTTYTFSTLAAIGARGDTFAGSFLGTLDEVTIYDRPLAPVEISALYNTSAGGKCLGPTPPAISVQPSDQTVNAGASVAFTVLANGSAPLSFQWQFHGTNLVGATKYTFLLTNAQLAAAGVYQAIITNAFGAVTSAPVTLNIQSAPVINGQPQSVTVLPGSSAQFVVEASGSLPLLFQWRRNGTNLPGRNNYSLIITNVQGSDAGNYTVAVSNSFGSVTSAPAALTLGVPASITNQPAGQSVPTGSNPSFTVGAIGSAPLSYQWRQGGTNLPGATNTLLNLNNVQVANAGAYSVVVSNNFGTAISSNALLTLTNPFCAALPSGLVAWWPAEGSTLDAVSASSGSLIGNTTNAVGKVGQAFSFDGSADAVLIGNPASLQLQDFTIEAWIKRTSPSLVSSNPAADGIVFSYGLGGYGFGLDNSGHLFLSNIGADKPTSTAAITDTNFHHMAVTKSGTNLLFYIDGVSYPAPPYVTAYSFTSPCAIGARGDNFSASFLGRIDELAVFNRGLTAGEVQSIYNATSVGKCALPLVWLAQPTNQSVTVGSNATFAATVSGSRPVFYQWRLNGTPVSSATNSVLTLLGVTFFQAGNYAIIASNTSGPITSSNAVLTVLTAPLFANGSFESGSTSWVLTDIANPVSPLAVHGAGFDSGFGFFFSAPTDGNFCLTHGFDGNGPGRIRAAFDVVLPASPVTLTFSYRAAWDMQNYQGSTLPRTFVVTIEPFGGGPALQTNTILTAAPGTANYDTGNLTASVNLSAFFHSAIRISFDFNIPEAFTGPGFFQLDNVVLSYAPTPPLVVARSGTNITLSWPVTFSNFAVQATTNLLSSTAWTTLATNPIVRGPTNASLTQPATPPNKFYRLKSF